MDPQAVNDFRSIQLVKSDQVAQRMKERHISDNEVKLAIHHGETTGEKLYQMESERFLTKLKFSGAVFYVEYSPTGDSFSVHAAYAHLSEIVGGE